MILLISGFFSFLLVILITPLIIKHFIKLGIVDKPDNHRKIHSKPIPRMGGIILYFIFIVFLFLFYKDISDIKFFLTGSLILVILGVVDDIKGVKWSVKFLVQSIVSVFMIVYLFKHNYFHFNIAGYPIPTEFAIPIVFLAILGLLNAFNLLDGLDGLIAGISLIVASLSFVLSLKGDSFLISLLSIVVIGSTLGFLKFNGNPARIFLGDTGAYTLGYFTLGILFSATAEADTNHSIDLAFLFIVFSLPVIDTLRVMLLRMSDKKNPFLPDNNHIHHIIYSKKIRHKTSVFIVLILFSITTVIALLYQYYSRELGIVIFGMFAPFIIFTGDIIEVVIRKENLLNYGRLVRRIPGFLIDFYNNYLLPFVAIILFTFFIYLIFHRAMMNDVRYIYLLIFAIMTFVYSLINLNTQKYVSDVLVFINFLLFFYVTGLNGIFYELHTIPLIGQININQLITIVLAPMLVFFMVFRERILGSIRDQIFTGVDLILAVLIISIFLFIQLSDQKFELYRFGDILLRSFLVYIFFKVVTHRFPKLHFQFYLSTFIIVIITLLRIVFP